MVMDKASKVNTKNLPEEVIDELFTEKAAPMIISENEVDDDTDDDEQESQATEASEESSGSLVSVEFRVEHVIDLLTNEQNGGTEVNQLDGLPEINPEKFLQCLSTIMPDQALEVVRQILEDPVNGTQDAMAPEIQRLGRVKTLSSNQGLRAEAASRLRTRNCQRPEDISSSTEDAIYLNMERHNRSDRGQKSRLNVGRRRRACAGEEKMKKQTWLPIISTELLNEIYSKSIDPTSFSPVSSSIKEPLYGLPIWTRPNRGWVKLNSCGMSRKVATASASKVSMNDVESAACGGVIRDCNGHPLLSFVKQLDKVCPYTAKAMGLYHGVLALFSLPGKLKNVWVQCDSREVVYFVSRNQMEGRAILKLLQEFEHWTITIAEGGGNALAEGMVAIGMDTGSDFCIHGDVPPPLRFLLQSELDIEKEFLRSNTLRW